MSNEIITKEIACRRQIRAAIRMLFCDEDALAVHTIIGAVDGLLVDLAGEEGVELEMEEMWRLAAPLHNQGERLKLERQAQNFLKHANKDPQGSIDFDPVVNELRLFFVCEHYGQVFPSSDSLVRLYRTWFMYKRNPQIDPNSAFGAAIRGLRQIVSDPNDRSAMLNLAARM